MDEDAYADSLRVRFPYTALNQIPERANQMQIQQKHVEYTPLMAEFLTTKGIEWFGTDADILCFKIESECHNDTEFVNLVLEYAKWLSDNDGDMTINREAMGGSYHRDPREAEQIKIDLYLKEQKLICERLYKQFTKQI